MIGVLNLNSRIISETIMGQFDCRNTYRDKGRCMYDVDFVRQTF